MKKNEIMIASFRNWRIRAKLITVTLFLVLLPLLCVAYLSTNRFNQALRKASEEDLEHLVRNIYSPQIYKSRSTPFFRQSTSIDQSDNTPSR